MTFVKPLTASLLLGALLSTATAFGDAEPGQLYISPMAVDLEDNSDRRYDSDTGAQLGIGGSIGENWNLEGYLQRLTPEGIAGQEQQSAGIDFQRVFRRPARFSPYLFLGVGFMDVEFDAGGDDSGAMWSTGAGFLADIFGSSRIALRGEYRFRSDNVNPRGDDDLVSLGLQIPFGRAATRTVDSDGDGVADSADRCPNTPRGTTVDAAGCPPSMDADGDGVTDDVDRCPNTPRGVAVNSEGCAPDADGDGVADYLDQCPATVANARVDANGCELDGDGDGVVDRLDRCPGTTRGVAIDVYGCEIEEEIRLPNVNFETNSDRLLPGAISVLEDAARTLQNNPGITVEVAGHTDSDGAADYNQQLSERRAITVRDFIIAEGVDANRLSVRGYGESQPTADNTTASGKAANRRVVLRVLTRD